jgi:hypothetical protein
LNPSSPVIFVAGLPNDNAMEIKGIDAPQGWILSAGKRPLIFVPDVKFPQ